MHVFMEGLLFQRILRISLQASVLVSLVIALQFLLRHRLSARWRHALWMLPLLRLVLPWTPPSPVSLFNAWPHKTVTQSMKNEIKPPARASVVLTPILPIEEGHAIAANEQGVHKPDRNRAKYRPIVLAPAPAPAPHQTRIEWRRLLQPQIIWLAGSLAFLMLLIAQVFKLRRTLKGATALHDPNVGVLLSQCKEQMGVHRALRIVEAPGVSVPALCGLFNLRLVLPQGMVRQLSREQLRHVFLHELSHLKQHDLALNWVMSLLQVIHWFNPVLWLAFHRIRSDRELACDERVLERTGARESRAYGETLLRVLSFIQCLAPFAGAGGDC